MHTRLFTLMLSTAISSTIGIHSWAQEDTGVSATGESEANISAEAETPPAEEPEARRLSSVIVTAQKREQSIGDIGAPISVFSGAALEDKNVVSLADLAATIPGLNYSETGYGTPVYTLRGVGFTDATLASYPDVSVYIDQVPLPFPVLTKNSNFDLERVEVLKGPQGTLFGSNATGGAINYIAAKPTDSLEGGMSVTYGRFNNLVADGYVSGPVSDTVRVRFAGRVQHRDDWQYSYTRDDTSGAISTAAARLMVDWDATDRLQFQLNVNGWNDQSDPQQTQYFAQALQAPAEFADPRFLAYPFAPKNPRAADWSDTYPKYGDSNFLQSTLRGTYEVTDNITLTSLTGVIKAENDVFAQADGVDLAVSIYAVYGEFESYFQELRLDNGGSDRFRWTLGLNYQKDDVDESAWAYFGESTAFGSLGITQTKNNTIQDSDSYAAFGTLEYDLLDNLTLKGGLRYTNTKREAESCGTDSGDGTTAAFFTFYQQLLNPGETITPLGIYDCYVIDPATNRSGLYTGELDEDNTSWRVGLDWKATDDLLLYANASKGYKAGGFPSTTASAFQEYEPVTQESLIDYEVGFKASLFDDLIFLEGNGFYYDYKDKQLRSKIITQVFGALNATVNIPNSSVRGAEISMSSQPISGFTPSFSATYLDATIDEFIGVNAGGNLADFGDTPMPLAPELSVNADLQYETQLTDSITGMVAASVTYRDETNALVGGSDVYTIPSYTLLDLRAGLTFDDGRLRVLAFAKNVTNEYYVNNVVRQYDAVVRFSGEPVTYGITVSREF